MRTRVEELFHEVADLPVSARVCYFAAHRVDTQTREEVEALIEFDSSASTSLERDIGQVAHGALSQLEPKDMPCGPYLLGELLGRGGMGTVYSAQRVDGEVAQRVAVKLLRPGADGPGLRQRFLAERQILAPLSHPNIARLLDAGHRDDGQPYLVMEYVEGKTVDAFTEGLGVRQKVTLFLKICAAVGYLHRNMVVHRDLKPANILVTEEGEPKLLDFGIAKMLDLTTDSTATGMRMLTPDYASPEQVTGGPVTTATDVYSLGAVLYRLLTGASPHQFEGDSAVAIALAISSGKIAPPAKLAPGLKGDLEMILVKALRKESQERYATIEQFSEDLENYLESRPIRARKGDAWYRTRKFVRRYWLPVAAATLAVAGLSAGILIANHQRAIAQRRFLQVRQLAGKLFDIDTEVRQVPGTTKARELIVGTSLEYLRRVAVDVQGDPELALELGNAYMRVARVQGVPISVNLGQLDQAAQNLRIADRFIRSVLESQPGNRTALLRSAQIAHDQMLLARFDGRSAEALALARKSAEWLEKFHAGKGDKSEASPILNTYLNVADQHDSGQQHEEALRLCRRAKDLALSLDRPDYVGNFLWVSAQVYRARGDLDQALQEIQESVTLLSANPGFSVQMNSVLAQIYRGRILGQDNAVNLGRTEEAVGSLDGAFRIADGWAHQDPNDHMSRGRLAMAGTSMGDMLRDSDPRRALEIYDHTFRHVAEVKNNGSFRRFEVSTLVGASYVLRLLNRPVEARQRLDAAFERLTALKLYPAAKVELGSEVEEALRALAANEAANSNLPRALEIYQELRDQIHGDEAQAAQQNPETNLIKAVRLSTIYREEAALRGRAGQADLAAALDARRRDLWQHWERRLPNNPFVRRQLEACPTSHPTN